MKALGAKYYTHHGLWDLILACLGNYLDPPVRLPKAGPELRTGLWPARNLRYRRGPSHGTSMEVVPKAYSIFLLYYTTLYYTIRY